MRRLGWLGLRAIETSSLRLCWSREVEIWRLGGLWGFWCGHGVPSLVFSGAAQRSTREITGKVRNLVGRMV
jgi:hypothetical protein